MTRHPLPSSLRRVALAAAVLAAGCLSRWSGCRRYDTGRLAGAGWTARVQCAPHTEVSLTGERLLRGCTARWHLIVERAGAPRRAELYGPRYESRDCGDVRRLCEAAHGELAQRATAVGTWVAARPPTGSTRLAFVPSACGVTHMLPEGTAPARSPEAAVAGQPDGPTYLDGVVARDPITSAAWFLVCGPVLAQRVVAVRAAALECRVPDVVANELFRTDPASVEAVWRALVAGRLPCAHAMRRILRQVASEALAALALRALAECEVRCPPRGRVEPLREAGGSRLQGARDAALRIASRGPPPRVANDASPAARAQHRDAFDEWLTAQWALSRIDPPRGTEVALATLRGLPAPEGVARLPTASDGPPLADYDDPASGLCSILLGDPARAREGLWAVASDEGVSAGARQHALLALARLGDPRATGVGLAHNPLTAEQAAAVSHRLDAARGVTRSTGSGHGHHHH